MVKTSGQRQGDKVFGVIAYFTGWFGYQGLEGRLNSAAYSAFLTTWLEQTTPPLMLIQDGATDHTSAAMQRFFALHTARLTVFQLPRYSPADHPLEQLWKKVKKEGTPLPYFPTCETLTDTGEQALLKFAHTPKEMLSLCSLPKKWLRWLNCSWPENIFLESYSRSGVQGQESRDQCGWGAKPIPGCSRTDVLMSASHTPGWDRSHRGMVACRQGCGIPG